MSKLSLEAARVARVGHISENVMRRMKLEAKSFGGIRPGGLFRSTGCLTFLHFVAVRVGHIQLAQGTLVRRNAPHEIGGEIIRRNTA